MSCRVLAQRRANDDVAGSSGYSPATPQIASFRKAVSPIFSSAVHLLSHQLKKPRIASECPSIRTKAWSATGSRETPSRPPPVASTKSVTAALMRATGCADPQSLPRRGSAFLVARSRWFCPSPGTGPLPGQKRLRDRATEVEPREVRIVGPRSRVARISAAVVTDLVDVSNVVGGSEFHVNLLARWCQCRCSRCWRREIGRCCRP